MIAFLYKVAVHMVEIPEDEDEKEVERDHYNWQLVSPFNTLVTVLMDEYDVEISVDDLVPENFNSVQAIYDLIERARG